VLEPNHAVFPASRGARALLPLLTATPTSVV
jgi:hypothetical protein